jgi:hypothetical protein
MQVRPWFRERLWRLPYNLAIKYLHNKKKLKKVLKLFFGF